MTTLKQEMFMPASKRVPPSTAPDASVGSKTTPAPVDGPSPTKAKTSKDSFPVTAPKGSPLWEDEVTTRDQLDAIEGR